MRGAYPRAPALAAQARHLNPSHFVTAPFRGKPAPAVPSSGVSAASMSATSRCRSACAAPPGVSFRLCRSRRNSNYSHASALCCGGAIRQTRPSPAKRAFARTKGRYSLPDMGSATTHERWRITSCLPRTAGGTIEPAPPPEGTVSAATDLALRGARRWALLAPDCCRDYRPKCPDDR